MIIILSILNQFKKFFHWKFLGKFAHTHTHTHPFNCPLSGTTLVSRYHKGKTNLDFTEARDSEQQWHQLGHMQVCTAIWRDSHASTPPLNTVVNLQLHGY